MAENIKASLAPDILPLIRPFFTFMYHSCPFYHTYPFPFSHNLFLSSLTSSRNISIPSLLPSITYLKSIKFLG